MKKKYLGMFLAAFLVITVNVQAFAATCTTCGGPLSSTRSCGYEVSKSYYGKCGNSDFCEAYAHVNSDYYRCTNTGSHLNSRSTHTHKYSHKICGFGNVVCYY